MADLIAMLSAVAGQQGEGDPNFNQTVLLLHGDGTNGAQNNTFLDSSTNNFTITRNGNVTQGSFGPFSRSSGNLVGAPYDPAVHGGSGYFDGTGDYLTMPSNSAFVLGTGDFSIEFFSYVVGNDNQIFYDFRSASSGTGSSTAFNIGRNNANGFFVFNNVAGLILQSGAGTATFNEWNHVVVSRVGTTMRLFVNGSQAASATVSTDFSNTQAPRIGEAAFSVPANPLFGYLSGFKLVKGSGVTSVTVPTTPPVDSSGTSLLLNFTNAGIFDNTGKNVLETVDNAQIDTTTKKYGTGSLEFDGTGDWLLLPNNVDQQLGTGNFTIEFWVYLASGDTGSARGLVAKGGSSTGWLVSLDSSQKVVFTYTTSTITSSGAITTNAWNHIAVVRSGTGSNQTKIYIGGTNDGTGTVSTDFNQTESMYVGANRTGGDPMKGFIDDLRITKGVARYTANFTVPDKAFPDL